MADRAAEIVESAKVILREIHGEEPDGERLALFLAGQVVHGADSFCFGFARNGRPSDREPKAPYVAVDEKAGT